MKKLVRLTEADLHEMIKESLHRILVKEDWKQELSDFNDGKGGENWHETAKKEIPDAKERHKAIDQHYKERDKAKGYKDITKNKLDDPDNYERYKNDPKNKSFFKAISLPGDKGSKEAANEAFIRSIVKESIRRIQKEANNKR